MASLVPGPLPSLTSTLHVKCRLPPEDLTTAPAIGVISAPPRERNKHPPGVSHRFLQKILAICILHRYILPRYWRRRMEMMIFSSCFGRYGKAGFRSRKWGQTLYRRAFGGEAGFEAHFYIAPVLFSSYKGTLLQDSDITSHPTYPCLCLVRAVTYGGMLLYCEFPIWVRERKKHSCGFYTATISQNHLDITKDGHPQPWVSKHRTHSSISSSMAAEKIINGWVSSPNSRGTLDIIWSSLFTIFLSTWTALHLNVPSPRDGFLKIAFRKFKWMLLTALMPEITVMFALAQWIQAKKTARFLKDELGCQDWGISQGFYVEMGGLSTETQIKTDTPKRCVDGRMGRRRLGEGPSNAERRAQLAADNQRSLGRRLSYRKNTHPDREAEESLEIEVLPISAPEPEPPKEPNVCRRARSGVWEKLPVGTIQLKWLIERGYLERRDHVSCV